MVPSAGDGGVVGLFLLIIQTFFANLTTESKFYYDLNSDVKKDNLL